MTKGETTTTLAETIARVAADNREGIKLTLLDTLAYVHVRDLAILLACARRCEAIDGNMSEALRSGRYFHGLIPSDAPTQKWLPVLLDAASERDALAKRVGELEGTDFIAYTNELVAESTRLREELVLALRISDGRAKQRDELCKLKYGWQNEIDRLRAELAELRLCHDEWKSEAGERHEELRKALAERNVALARVRELEGAASKAISDLDKPAASGEAKAPASRGGDAGRLAFEAVQKAQLLLKTDAVPDGLVLTPDELFTIVADAVETATFKNWDRFIAAVERLKSNDKS